MPHHVGLAADHHAVAALEPPDAAAGADVDVVNPLGFQGGGAADVVVIIRVAAVDQDISPLEPAGELVDRRIDDRRGHHQPDGPRRLELGDKFLEARRPDGPILDQRGRRGRVDVVNHALLAWRSRRRTMFEPIRPRPIMPSCMAASQLNHEDVNGDRQTDRSPELRP